MQGNLEKYHALLLSKGPDTRPPEPYADHPSGIVVQFGITKSMLSEWRQKPANDDELRAISLDTAKSIIAMQFWNPARCNDIVGGLDICVADWSRQSGVRRAVKELQTILGFTGSDVDGFLGPTTLGAIAANDPATLIREYMDARSRFVHADGSMGISHEIWQAHLHAIEDFAMTLVPAKAPELVAKIDRFRRRLATTVATLGTAVGTAIPIILAAMPAAKDAYGKLDETLTPFREVAPWLTPVCGGTVVVAVLWLHLRNATMAHNAEVSGTTANVVAAPRLAPEAGAAS